MIKKESQSISNPGLFNKAFGTENLIKPYHREETLEEPSIIVTTAGMLNGGPVLFYIDRICNDAKSKLLLTGYQADGTNGRLALNHGIIHNEGRTIGLKCKIEQYNFSAHAGDEQLKDVVRGFVNHETEIVIPVHGDNTKGFATWIEKESGVTAIAPKNDTKIYI
jgi:putative mRNA 3-end processing factor